jgi:hypothetical protein
MANMTLKESPPNRSLSKGGMLALIALLIGALLSIYFVSQPRLVPGQSLVDIQSVETLREQFNNDAGKTRLILIASPT